MEIRAEHYFDAARQRVETARRLHEAERFSAAVYFAGVAVECLLRAFIVRRTPEFDARHDLRDLYKRSELGDMIPEDKRRDVAAWLGEVWERWKNNYRYASDERLEAEFRRQNLNRGIKGNFLKKNSHVIIEAALKLMARGELAWRSATK